jgi:hypothetical protein
MKIRMSVLKKLIREAITSLASSQGFRAAGLAAGGTYRRDIPKFKDPGALSAAVVDEGDHELLFDTLRQMLADDESAGYLDPGLAKYISDFISTYEALTAGGMGSGDAATTVAALDNLVRTGLEGLYDAGSSRSIAKEMFRLVAELGPESLEHLAAG